jgi:hypothetical protein
MNYVGGNFFRYWGFTNIEFLMGQKKVLFSVLFCYLAMIFLTVYVYKINFDLHGGQKI